MISKRWRKRYYEPLIFGDSARGLSLFMDTPPQSPPCQGGEERGGRTGTVPGLVLTLCLLWPSLLMAGDLDSPGAPGSGSGMPTLKGIYDRLDTGADLSVSGSFAEPVAGPGATGVTLNNISSVLPKPDNTNGLAPSEAMSGKTFWGLKSGTWGPQTGSMVSVSLPTALVAATGQTTSYATGDDGNLLWGVSSPNPRFTDNSDGTVTDNLTGLVWLKNANCASTTRAWAVALTDVANLNIAGTMNSNDCGDISNGGTYQTDWRLPNRKELRSLVNYGLSDVATWLIDQGFTSVQANYYWSATYAAPHSYNAWMVNMFNGTVNASVKVLPYYVWPVRAGQ